MSNSWRRLLIAFVVAAVIVTGCATKKSEFRSADKASSTKTTVDRVSAGNSSPKSAGSPAYKDGRGSDVSGKAADSKPAVEQQKDSGKPSDSGSALASKPQEKPSAVKGPSTAEKSRSEKSPTAGDKAQSSTKPKPTAVATKKLPRLVDLGASECIPCKMMMPVIDELAKEYKGKLEVEFIDVWRNPAAAEKYGIRSIPTQIFFDEEGKEFYRHIGYISKENILKIFENHGIKLTK
jgi:thioredoxin 1